MTVSLFQHISFTAEDVEAYRAVAECYAHSKGPEAIVKFEAAEKVEQEMAPSRTALETIVVLSIAKAKANLMVAKMKARRTAEEPLLDAIDTAGKSVEHHQIIATKRILLYRKMTPTKQSEWWAAVHYINFKLEDALRSYEAAKKEHAEWQAKYDAAAAMIEERDDLWIAHKATEALIDDVFSRWCALKPADREITAEQLTPAAEAADAAKAAWKAFRDREKARKNSSASTPPTPATQTTEVAPAEEKAPAAAMTMTQVPDENLPVLVAAVTKIESEEKPSSSLITSPMTHPVETPSTSIALATVDRAPAATEIATMTSEKSTPATVEQTTTLQSNVVSATVEMTTPNDGNVPKTDLVAALSEIEALERELEDVKRKLDECKAKKDEAVKQAVVGESMCDLCREKEKNEREVKEQQDRIWAEWEIELNKRQQEREMLAKRQRDKEIEFERNLRLRARYLAEEAEKEQATTPQFKPNAEWDEIVGEMKRETERQMKKKEEEDKWVAESMAKYDAKQQELQQQMLERDRLARLPSAAPKRKCWSSKALGEPVVEVSSKYKLGGASG